MEHQCSPLLTWAYFCQGKNIDELRQSLLLTTLELETVRARAHEELTMRDEELNHLKDLLSMTIRERDEAHDKNQKLLFEKFLLQQQSQQQIQTICNNSNQTTDPLSGNSCVDDEPLPKHNKISSSESEESTVSSPQMDEHIAPLIRDKPLPEQGKLLQAVMKAGPLLQTLLLAGPLPEWRHPPPPIDTYQIPPPPVTVPLPLSFENCGSRKRGLCEGHDVYSPSETKYQRVVLH